MIQRKILIVGGGPVGLSAALFLNKHNHRVTIIQKNLQRNIYSKALLTNTRTLNLFHTVDVDRQIISRGSFLEGAQIFFNNESLFKVKFNEHRIESKGFYGQKAVFIPQSKVEDTLEESLKGRGVVVKRGVELVGVKNVDNAKVEAVVKEGGEQRKESYDYVLGCDGAKSVVRHEIQARFEGHTVDDRVMYMSDLKLPENSKFDKVGMRLFTKPEPYLLAVLPVEKNVVRVISTKPEYLTLLPAELSSHEELWKTTFKINHRLASKLREGNIFLAGDAGHVHSPLGGRGMNIGIQDVYVFSQLLNEGRLDEYEQERYKVLRPLVKRIRTMSEVMMIPTELKYRTLGLMLKGAAWMLPETAYKNAIVFFTGQDHQV